MTKCIQVMDSNLAATAAADLSLAYNDCNDYVHDYVYAPVQPGAYMCMLHKQSTCM